CTLMSVQLNFIIKSNRIRVGAMDSMYIE
ncbi:unnamed protein product, partial [Rotaria sp. Silwood2]